ncbi:Hpt domain-containing protein [Microbulbifer variabilis]|uniref:histidine kinase n=2 Tax=Microbulbifer variabilis TaxID=266805 RepID=A0ABY4VF61_9GAMM|nr:Hpt domain-containing protein [Microbulbifer variabilis]USD21788.1 Hpt domain-containing protein [Microbulbifer variabilis]
MSHDNPNFMALDWLIGEINETLAQARQFLETFATDPQAGETLLQNSLSLVHQVHGSLHMAQLNGAAMLAEEMEQLLQSLAGGTVENTDETREFMMRALLELPLYLEKVSFQRRDNAVLLLPLLNDLRAVRRERLITEGALFSPDLTSSNRITGKRQPLTADNVRLQELVGKLRKMYHVAAAGLIRDVNSGESLSYLVKIVEKLQLLYSGSRRQSLWEVLLGILEALAEHRINVQPALRHLLRRVDVEFRLLQGRGARVLDAELDADFLSNLLFYVYLAGPNGSRCQELYQRFALDRAVPGTPRPDTEDVLAMGPEALGTAITALREELQLVREALEPSGAASELPPLSETAAIAKRIADTLGVLGLEAPRGRARGIYEYLRDASRGTDVEEYLMRAAGELVQLDSALSAAVDRNKRGDNEQPIMGDATDSVLREARLGLEAVKEAVMEYVASHWDISYLSRVPQRLQEVCGGLEMVGYQRASKIIAACNHFISDALIDRAEQPEWRMLDTLADAITSVEYYLERRVEGLDDTEMLLALAEDSVANLGIAFTDAEVSAEEGESVHESVVIEEDNAGLELFSPEFFDSADTDKDNREEQLLNVVSATAELEIESVPNVEQPVEKTLDLQQVEAPVAKEANEQEDNWFSTVESTVEPETLSEAPAVAAEEEISVAMAADSEDVLSPNEVEPLAETGSTSEPVEGESQELVDDSESLIDDEIIEIFLEEASEVLAHIGNYFPEWAANFANSDALVEFRRGFHTLKGSGRMVEALDIGELAWSVENMLNRVIDDSIKPERAHVLLIERVYQKLPSMIEAFRLRKSDPDKSLTLQLQAWAEQLSQGHIPSELLVEDANTAATATVEEEECSDERAQLWEIFAQEAETHLSVVDDYLADMRAAAPVYGVPSDPLHRALHTLKGSAHMAEVKVVAEMMAPLERFAKELRIYQVPIDADIFELIGDGANYVRQVLAQIRVAEPIEVERAEQFLARVAELQERSVGHLIREREANEPRAVDPQLLEVLMADGMRVLLDADQMLNQWRANPADKSQVSEVAEELNTLQEAASRAQLPTLAELAQLLLEVYRKVLADQLEEEPALWASLEQGHNELLDLVDAVAAAQDLPEVSEAVEEALRYLAEGEVSEDVSEDDYDLSELGIEAQTLDPAAGEAAEVSDLETENIEEHSVSVDEVQASVLEPISAPTAESVSATLPEVELESTQSTEVETVDTPMVEMVDKSAVDSEGVSPEPVLDDLYDALFEVAETTDICADKTAESEQSAVGPAIEAVEPVHQAPTVEVVSESQAGLSIAEQQRLLADIDPDVVDVFMEEAGDLTDELEELIQAWEDTPESGEQAEALKRVLHTFKGGARMAGLMGLGEVAHRFETAIEGMRDIVKPSAQFFSEAHFTHDRIAEGVETVRAWMAGEQLEAFVQLITTDWADIQNPLGNVSEPVTQAITEEVPPSIDSEFVTVADESIVVDKQESLSAESEERPEPEQQLEPSESLPQPLQSSDAGNVLPFIRKPEGVENEVATPTRNQPQEMVRVAAELLEELVNLAGETAISRGRLEEQMSEFGLALDEMDSTLLRLNEQLRRLDRETEAQILFRQEQLAEQDGDFDPLEMDRYSSIQQLSRSLLESTSDLMELRSTLDNKARDTETLLLQQSRVNTELQEGLMRSRMVPFSRLVPRLRRIVRQVSAELGKQVELVFSNVEGELDRSMLERMVAPLEHMLRNAVDHGIEMPDARRAAGKAERGRIDVALAREGSEVVLTIRDDGAGVNLIRVREKAVENGLMRPDAELSNTEILQFILQAGFTTAEKVTQISGRGVGMDVVSAELKQIGGSVHINSEAGAGTEFVVRLPFTVSVNRALMVKIGEDLFALPLNTIEGIVRLSPFELEHYYRSSDARFEYAGELYEVNYFGTLLKSGAQPKLSVDDMQLPVLLVRSEGHAMALQVDAIRGSREIVVKSLGPQFSGVQGVSGATVTGDGSVVVILDAHALLRRQATQLARPDIPQLQLQVEEQPEREERQQTVMVVDDSVTVRKVTTRFLEREGYLVSTAKDGQDAVIQLQDKVPDLILLDIEMPRMDGFEVARHIRSSSRLRDIPIVMITSRTGSKHRDHAMSLGVNHYLGKPYQEDVLLEAIREYAGTSAVGS